MKFLVFFAFVALAYCHPLEDLKNLLLSVNEDGADELRNKTKTLINAMESELDLLKGLVETEIESTALSIQTNLNIVLNYSVSRTQELSDYLINKIQTTAKVYPAPAQKFCLSLTDYIKGVPASLRARISVSLYTAARKGNTTIRDDVYQMDNIKLGIDALTQSLVQCADDYDCLVEVADEAVVFNTEFINTFNDILINYQQIPKNIVDLTVKDVGNVVAVNEDFVCNTADIMLDCLASYDDEIPPVTTVQPDTTVTDVTTVQPDTTVTDVTTHVTDVSDVTDATTSDQFTATGLLATTETPVEYCQHPPFSPNVNI